MKRQILLLAITAAALSSCTTAYKTGQTPDDVYFSPTRPQDEYVRTEQKEEPRYDENNYDDRYLRMKVHNRTQWDYLDDWYSYERYGYSANRIYGSYYNPYTSWNYYYNPYCHNNVIAYYPGQTGHPGLINVAQNDPKPRNFSLASYTNTNFNNANNNNVKMNSYKSGLSRPVYNNRNSNDGFSNTLKQIFNSGNNSSNSNSSYSPPSRSYSPSSSSSGSSGGSSGSSGSSSGSSGGGASRPSRGGN
jgi:uncharacterized membrane protein YgcG